MNQNREKNVGLYMNSPSTSLKESDKMASTKNAIRTLCLAAVQMESREGAVQINLDRATALVEQAA